MKRKSIIEYCNDDRIEVDILENFHFKEGEINTGLVIEDNENNQYLRIPSGYTSDGLYVRGFWVSRYEMSEGEDGKICSVPGNYPITDIDFRTAEELAEKAGGMLVSKEEYNRICMWMVETKAASFEEVFVRGSSKGNFSNPFKVTKTGSNPLWMINRLDNFFGSCYIWTTEKSELYSHNKIIRGGHSNELPINRIWVTPRQKGKDITFRVVIHDVKEDEN